MTGVAKFLSAVSEDGIRDVMHLESTEWNVPQHAFKALEGKAIKGNILFENVAQTRDELRFRGGVPHCASGSIPINLPDIPPSYIANTAFRESHFEPRETAWEIKKPVTRLYGGN